MNAKKGEEKTEPSLKINTKKYRAIPMKNPSESALVISTAKKSRIKAKVKCQECGALANSFNIKKCKQCGRNICLQCSLEKKGKIYCKNCA